MESCVVYAGENITGKVEKIKDDTIEGCIDISENQSPLKYVKSKILFTIDGKEYISYGKGCLCGALSFDEDDMKLSQQR